ncbi:paraquat-inducible protein A [Verrucomicrobiota bacterium]
MTKVLNGATDHALMTNTDNQTEALYKSSGKTGIIVSIMLILSLLFNISALLAPFYTAKLFMKAPFTFTLPHSVMMLWNHRFFFISTLLFSFSIVFPFLKLAILFYIWFVCRNRNRGERLITLIGPLGRWSMLDIFVTVVLMVLTNNQFLITSSLKMGVYFFLTAIFLSMTCALRMEILMFSPASESRAGKRLFIKKIGNISYTRRILVFLSLILCLTILLLAIEIPMIKIHGFFFAHNEYSILTSVITLWSTSKVLTLFVFLTLILCPLLHILGLMAMWLGKLGTRLIYRIERAIHVISAFNMLDVFCLGLFISMTEGRVFMVTEEQTGLYILLVFLFCAYLIPIWIKGTHKNYLQFAHQALKDKRSQG